MSNNIKKRDTENDSESYEKVYTQNLKNSESESTFRLNNIEIIRGLNEITSSNLSFTKETKEALKTSRGIITPFIPLIGKASISITEIESIYRTSQYNKNTCNLLLDRAKLSEIAIDQLLRRRKENEKYFKSQTWYKAFHRFVIILDKIKTFGEKISQLQEIKIFFKTKNILETFKNLMADYDTVMKDLDFTMAIINEQQRQIDYENVNDDMTEINEFLKKIDDGNEENKVKIALIFEEVQSIRSMKANIEVNRIDNSKLTEPKVRREGDIRGYRRPFLKRNIYMNTKEVACMLIKILDFPETSERYKQFQRRFAVYIKATQLPNIIQFYGISNIDDYKFAIFEWAELGNLESLYLKENGIPLDLKVRYVSLSYALDICRGIMYLNALDIYHCDLRCKNVLITANNVAKLTKFDYEHRAELLEERIEHCRWFAPEKLKDYNHRYDHKCEIFSFGMLLWELTFESTPYKDKNIHETVEFVINGGRENIRFDITSPKIDNIQNDLERIIRNAWNQNPDARISISKLLIDLDTLSKSFQEVDDTNESFKLEDPNNNGDEISYNSNSIDEVSVPIIPITDGIQAHKVKDYETAWKCFEEQAENQNSIGKYWKAYYLMEGFFGQKKDKMAGLALFKEAADEGVVDAQYRYACALLDNDTKSKLKVNIKVVIKYLRLAAENDSSPAQFHIGEAYSKGNLGYEQNLEMAKFWYKRAALHNDNHAINARKRLEQLKLDDK